MNDMSVKIEQLLKLQKGVCEQYEKENKELLKTIKAQEEQIRLYRLMEKLNWFFHQEMHYLDRNIAEQTARECYPEIRDFTYDILWNDLPKEIQKQLMDEEESL